MTDKKSTRYGGLPERVLRAIRIQQETSERLVGWFQLGHQPPDERQKRTNRVIEGVEKPIDLVVLSG